MDAWWPSQKIYIEKMIGSFESGLAKLPWTPGSPDKRIYIRGPEALRP
jgi:hypothetical protein